ncbi:MAG: hypothetical protein ABL895_19445 [Cyclobacteriaceae bacterium]
MDTNRFFIFIYLISLVAFGQDERSITLVNSKFSVKPFGEKITPLNLNKLVIGKMTTEIRIIQNRNSQNKDTLLIYNTTGVEFAFLKSKGETFFYGSTIEIPDVKLAMGIRVGLSKNEFLKIFNINNAESQVDKVVITDESEFCYNYFYFEKEKLTKIILGGCID